VFRCLGATAHRKPAFAALSALPLPVVFELLTLTKIWFDEDHHVETTQSSPRGTMEDPLASLSLRFKPPEVGIPAGIYVHGEIPLHLLKVWIVFFYSVTMTSHRSLARGTSNTHTSVRENDELNHG
jgi:hypothetical protein